MKYKKECGSVIVEASIVFPVMFLVIFFMIFAGNAYLQKCRVESIINECAIDGASYCADPMLNTVSGGSIPSLDSWEVYPYRAFSSTGVGDVEGTIEGIIESKVGSLSSGLFSGMKPQDFEVQTNYKNGILYGTFSVDASYSIKIPVRLMGQDENTHLMVSTHVEVPVSDTAELIRNIDMIWDYMERFGVAAKIEEMVNAAKEWFNR